MSEYEHTQPTVTVSQNVTNAGVSVGMAVFLAFMANLSFPLPWTPVPFSMMPFALLVTGVVQRPAWAAASVVIYLLAGGMGAHIFAQGESGWQHFVGSSAGYLFAFPAVSWAVSSYMQRPQRTLTGAWRGAVLGLIAVGALAGVAAIFWLMGQGQGFADVDGDAVGFGTWRSVAWIGVFLIATATATALLLRGRMEGRAARSVHMFLVFMAAIIMLHICGVLVLWAVSPLNLISAIILGSIVFLPFDILKAGLAVGVTLPFLQTVDSEDHHA